MIGFPKVPFAGFQGVWSRGNPDEVPFNHLVDGLNLRFNTLEGVFTREGSVKGSQFPFPINDWFLSKRPNPIGINTISDLIICDGAGKYYTLSNQSAILTVANGIALIGVNLFGRTYFCPIISGYGGSNGLYLYDGNQTRLAAGFGPSASPAMIAVGSAGNIPPGQRTIYCSFLTDTGFLTPPGASVVVNPSSASQFALSQIPIGDSHTVKRYLLSTQAGGAIPYFIPQSEGGIIGDNTTTTGTINFFDTDLINSADYLLNLLSTVQINNFAMGCIFFANRLVVWPGPVAGGGGSTIAVSRIGDFESFDQTSCFINVNRDDGHSVLSAFVLNNVLYFCKDLGVYSTYDNGNDPNTWSVDIVDGSIAVPPKGIAYISSNQSPVAGAVIIADKSGITSFNGSFQRPELTWKVESIWRRINQAAWNTVNLTIDNRTHSIYAAIPLDSATKPSHILYGDFSMALEENLLYVDPLKIKWDLWQLPNNSTVVGMIDLTGESYPILRVGSIDNIGNVIKFDANATDDYGVPINSFMQTAYGFLAKSKQKAMSDFNCFFAGMKWNAFGSALITATGYGYNGKIQRQLFTRQLNSVNAIDLLNPINFTSQKLSIKLAATSKQFTVNGIDLYGKPMFILTPQ